MVRQYRYITFQDRKQISTRYLNGDRVADIADGLGVTAATVYRELKRGETEGWTATNGGRIAPFLRNSGFRRVSNGGEAHGGKFTRRFAR